MSFGVTADYWNLKDTHWRPQSDNCNPTAAGEGQAEDSHGDIRASTVHGKAKAWRTAYKVVAADSTGAFALATKVKLGNIVAIDSATKGVVTGIELATSNKDFPVVTVSGVQFFGDTLNQQHYTVPNCTAIKAQKRVQTIGVTVDTNNRANSCTLNATLQVVQCADSLGAFVQTDAYQGRVESTVEAVNATATPTLAADSGWTEAKDEDVNTSNTEYGKGVITVFRNILPDT